MSIILVAIFSFIGGIHFYWALGGKWGSKAVIPSKQEESPYTPPPIATIIVGLGLWFMGSYFLFHLMNVAFYPSWIGWSIAGLFFIRFIGDFNYIGITKRIHDTRFARADNRLFTPLCLVISLLTILIELT